MACCTKPKLTKPSVKRQITSLVLSVANVLANAIKTGKVIADEATVSKRIETCKKCRHLDNTRCSICGCFINVKAGLKSEKCPINNW